MLSLLYDVYVMSILCLVFVYAIFNVYATLPVSVNVCQQTLLLVVWQASKNAQDIDCDLHRCAEQHSL